MDPTRSEDVLRHVEKQYELLKEAHNKMADELHKLQVEEEMLMYKFYQVNSTFGLINLGKRTDNAAIAEGDQDVQTANNSSQPSEVA